DSASSKDAENTEDSSAEAYCLSTEEIMSSVNETEYTNTMSVEDTEEEIYNFICFELSEGGMFVLTYPDGSQETITSDMMSEDYDVEINLSTQEEIEISAEPDSGYVLDCIQITDGEGSLLDSFDSSDPFMISANPEYRITVSAVFVMDSETTAEADTEVDSESGIMALANPESGIYTVTTSYDSVYEYEDYGLGTYHTRRYSVSLDYQGSAFSAYAFCLQPKRTAPANGTYSMQKLDNDSDLAKVIYYCLDENSPVGSLDYGARYILGHITAAYAYGSSDWSFKTSSTAQSYAMELYNWCISQEAVPTADFSLSETSVDAYEEDGIQRTADITFSAASSRQSISFSLPDEVRMYYRTSDGSEGVTEAGADVTIGAGTTFYFTAPYYYTGDTSWTVELTGNWTTSSDVYALYSSEGTEYQDVGFVCTTEDIQTCCLTVQWLSRPEVTLVSNAVSTESDTQILPVRESVEVSDAVAYTHVSSSYRYCLETQFVDITDKNRILQITGTADENAAVSEDGLLIRKEFQPENNSGTYDSYGEIVVTAYLNTESLNGHVIVAVDYLYQYINGNWMAVAAHDDLTDTKQTLYVPDICTSARDGQTEDHVGVSSSETVIYDEVILSNILFKESETDDAYSYTVKGHLVYQKDFTDEDGMLHKAGEMVETLDGTMDEAIITSDTTGNTTASVEMAYIVDSSKLKGGAVVVFEDLYYNDTLIASHADINDSGQTVYYPSGKTNASDSATGEPVSRADSDRTIVDRVYFENLLVGQEYTISGQLVFAENFTDVNGVRHNAGEAITDPVTVSFVAAEDVCAAEYSNGSGTAAIDTVSVLEYPDGQKTISGFLSISFSFDASVLAGATAVAFETFSHNGITVFTHEDLKDLAQTVKIPRICTTAAVQSLDEASVYDSDGNYMDITITDTVAFENLWTEEEDTVTYILKGVLMDKETGRELVNSEGETYVVYSEAFTPSEEDGTCAMHFTLNAGDFLNADGESELAGKTLVVFEELYIASAPSDITEDNKVAEHHDLNDTEQDIRFPNGSTHATAGSSREDLTDDAAEALKEQHKADTDTAHEVEASGSMTITDRVVYENLHGNTLYTVKGTLQVVTSCDADGTPTAWEPAVDSSGKIITAEAVIDTGKSSSDYNASVSGFVDLNFSFSGINLAGKRLVAFEEITRDGTTVFVHADITDDAQTITVLTPPEETEQETQAVQTEQAVKTGDNMGLRALLTLFIMAAALLVTGITGRRFLKQ
ncbi:MAG: VaFE repeat-containing surface-anchored protein, partial [Lachnospiraceae bacterium]|nr:VaFE repeat-containing surface-anchored protein [Lachnospiraceae bacterium]